MLLRASVKTKLTSTPSMLERLRKPLLQPGVRERILIPAVGQQLCAATRDEKKTIEQTIRDTERGRAMPQLRRGDMTDQSKMSLSRA